MGIEQSHPQNSIIILLLSSTHLELSSAEFKADLEPLFNRALQIPLQATSKILEHRRTSGQDNVLQWEGIIANNKRLLYFF